MTERTRRDYTVGRWHELPHYQCRVCPYNTLSQAAIEAHLSARHGTPPEPPRMAARPRIDRFGNLLEE